MTYTLKPSFCKLKITVNPVFQVRDNASVIVGKNYFAGTALKVQSNNLHNRIFYAHANDNRPAFQIDTDRRVAIGADYVSSTTLTVRDSYNAFEKILSLRNNLDNDIFEVYTDGTLGVNQRYSDVIMNVTQPPGSAGSTIFQVEKENGDDLLEINPDSTVIFAMKGIGNYADVQYDASSGFLGYDNSSRRYKQILLHSMMNGPIYLMPDR